MKRLKKMASLLVSLLMVFGMGIVKVNAATALDQDATLTITNIEAGSTVKLYKIWQAKYNDSKDSITGWTKAEGTNFANPAEPTAEEITTMAAELQASHITPLDTITATVSGTSYTYNVTNGASAYIAVITSPSNSDTIYNPILLSAKYTGTSTNLSNDSISTKSDYLYGSKTVAKSSKPKVDKEAVGTTDNTGTEGNHVTGSVGDKITYNVTVTTPVYPLTAVNKTVYVTDTLSEGLTFHYDSLMVKVNDKTYKIDVNDNKLKDDNDDVIGTAKNKTTGFEISLDYDALNYNNPVVTYTATINSDAVIGRDGNDNTFTLYYANNPTQGTTYTELPPQEDKNIKTKEDKEKVYTYQISFKKTDDTEDHNPLAGAVFGIYSDRECTKLVDTVTTNENGYASSSQVGYGTYYVKEITAPSNYTLNSEVFEVTSSWEKVTTKSTSETVTTTYTSVESEATVKEQVGWLKNNVFYSLDNKPEGDNVVKAYIKNTTITTASTSTFTENTQGAGVVLMADIINTKNPELPSTGGMGTVIFTVLGAGLITLAVVLKITRKRRS